MVFKEIVLGYVAALMLISHISLISCKQQTCIVPAIPRDMVPKVLLKISDYLAQHSFIDIKVLHLFGQLSLLAEAIILFYLVFHYVLSTALSYLWLTFKILAVVLVVGLGLATYFKGLPWVMSIISKGGWQSAKSLLEELFASRGIV